MTTNDEMRYFSTRGGSETLSFEEAVLTGLAPNGGLYIPTHIPDLPPNWQSAWSDLSFPQLSHAILSLFIPTSSIPSADLETIINKAYSSFRSKQVTPLRKLGEKEYVLELWWGPTWAFKDVALQFLGEVFAYFLERRNGAKAGEGNEAKEELTVLGATSGDTGSAAIYGLRSKPSITIFILYPSGRISPIQEAQMATVLDRNVYCVAVEDSDFDTCQSYVKTLFSDKEFNAAHRLGAINSINWARILAQIVYYFHAWFQLPKELREGDSKVQFVVPTGNFGDILAGWYAKKLGLPMGELVVATNENDILERFFRTGRYEPDEQSSPAPVHAQAQAQAPETAAVNGSSDGQQASPSAGSGVKATLSPAMDILLSSNFERLLYYLALDTLPSASSSSAETAEEKREKAQARLRGWMEDLKNSGKAEMGDQVRQKATADFWAERVSDEQTLEEIKKYFAKDDSYVVDPHTAVGLAAQARSAKRSPSSTWITLSTAHPAKFSSAVESALATTTSSSSSSPFDFARDVLPQELAALQGMKKRVYNVKGLQGVRDLIEKVKRGEKYEAHGEGAGSI